MIYGAGTARVKHRATGEVYDLDLDAMDWPPPQIDRLDEELSVSHDVLGRLTWRLTSDGYSAVSWESDLNGHELIEDFSFVCEVGPVGSGLDAR